MVFHSYQFILGFLPAVYVGFVLAHRIGGWSAGDIAYYFETGFTPDFDTVGGSMAAVQRNLAMLADGEKLVPGFRAARSSKSTPSSSCADASDAPRGARRSTDPRIRRRRRCAAVVARRRGPARGRKTGDARARVSQKIRDDVVQTVRFAQNDFH